MVDIVMKRDAQGRERPQERDFERAEVVRVVPKNAELRKYLKHPTRGRMNAEGSTEWPNDQFTRRRIKEGDVTIEETAAAKAEGEPRPEGEPKVIESSGAKSSSPRKDREAPPTETSAAVDPDKTTAPKTA